MQSIIIYIYSYSNLKQVKKKYSTVSYQATKKKRYILLK